MKNISMNELGGWGMVRIAAVGTFAILSLFLLSPLSGTTLAQNIATGDLRFIGATLLHVLSSSLIGVALGLTFYAPKVIHYLAGFIGLLLAMGLHMTFNYLILNTPQEYILQVFALVWVGVIVLLALLEYIKRIKPSR
jgi:hypothetical protein